MLPGVGNCRYTPLSTAGTTTLNQGPAGPQSSGQPSSASVLYGCQVNAVGTGFSIAVYDLIPPSGSGTNTATITNTMMPTQSGTAGQYLTCGPPDLGVRALGSMVAVTTGTPGQILALWDG